MVKRRALSIALMALALILVTIGAVNAELITTNVLRSYDDGSQQYENGNITMWLNTDPQPFYTRLDFSSQNPGDLHPDACGVGTSTYWAGDATIGLYHEDNAPAGAPGFQSTAAWSLVPCNIFDTQKYATPADKLATCVPGNPEDGACVLIGTPDTEVACSTGNCALEIETNFHINTDLACDGTMDEPFASLWQAGNLCLYWEAQKPPPTPANQAWGGNIQVRYGTGASGDKTINFNELLGPNAVSMSSLAATAEANSGSLFAWAGAMLLGAAALWLWRKQSAI